MVIMNVTWKAKLFPKSAKRYVFRNSCPESQLFILYTRVIKMRQWLFHSKFSIYFSETVWLRSSEFALCLNFMSFDMIMALFRFFFAPFGSNLPLVPSVCRLPVSPIKQSLFLHSCGAFLIGAIVHAYKVPERFFPGIVERLCFYFYCLFLYQNFLSLKKIAGYM